MLKRRICFIVGSMAISGGTYVIIQHASYLKKQGYDVTLAVQEKFSKETLIWHDQASMLRCLPVLQAKQESFDLVVATWWKTVFDLKDFDAPRFAYFVQSIESRFYPEAEVSLRALVDATYSFPLAYVTEAKWIKQYLSDYFNQSAELVRNGIRKDIYSPIGATAIPRVLEGKPRILVEGYFGVAFKNTALALRLSREAGSRDISLLTGSSIRWLPRVDHIFSKVPMINTPEIYRSCDILVKLSTVEGMFGPPLEMFHCGGTAVIFDVTGHDEYIVDGVNARVVNRNDLEGVVKSLQHLLTDKEYLAHLKKGAIQTAESWPDWEQSSSEFQDWIKVSLDGPIIERKVLSELTDHAYANCKLFEQQDLTRRPWIMRRHNLNFLTTRMPSFLVTGVKQLEAIGEVLFGKREAF